MSVREEDRNKNCPSRGLGIAAAAIGVGVGAALYYFFSKRENPADEGATSGWAGEQPQALTDHDSSYTTISEHSTTDTSIHDTSSSSHNTSGNIINAIARRFWDASEMDFSEESMSSGEDHSQSDNSHDHRLYDDSHEDHRLYDDSHEDQMHYDEENESVGNLISELNDTASDSDTNMEWDVTTSSLNVPSDEVRSRSPIMMQFGELTVRLLNPNSSDWKSAGEQMSRQRQQAFRNRSWSLEECSICFEVMLIDQEVLSLPCAHRFHQGCVLPWLQEHQTCPNCRKAS